MRRRYRLLIAEDHTILRQGLVSLLSKSDDLEVVGEAGDGLEALALVRRLRPDLVLMDLSMPRMGGLEAIREISRRHCATRVLALTAHRTEEYAAAALESGAAGYVLKDSSVSELLEAVRGALSGQRVVSPAVRSRLRRPRGGGAAREGTAWDTLTQRERGVLKLIAEGHRNREIAELLGISAKTVEKHRANLMAKLDLHSASALTSYAVRRGLVS